MSSVKGRIAVDVQFADSTTSAGVQSLKTITLQDATEYATGKVAVVTGTVGTNDVTITPSSLDYVNASGLTVSIAVSRIAFQASRVCRASAGDAVTGFRVWSDLDQPLVTNVLAPPSSILLRCFSTAGTASFTMVLYGS